MGNTHKKIRLEDERTPKRNSVVTPINRQPSKKLQHYQALPAFEVPKTETLPFRLELEQSSCLNECFSFFGRKTSPRLTIKPLDISPRSKKR